MKGIATITVHLNKGQTIHLQDVLYVPDLKKNLVSIFTMERYMHGIRTLKMLLLLGLGLMVFIKLVEVLWEIWQMTSIFNVSYGTKDFLNYFTKPYLA